MSKDNTKKMESVYFLFDGTAWAHNEDVPLGIHNISRLRAQCFAAQCIVTQDEQKWGKVGCLVSGTTCKRGEEWILPPTSDLDKIKDLEFGTKYGPTSTPIALDFELKKLALCLRRDDACKVNLYIFICNPIPGAIAQRLESLQDHMTMNIVIFGESVSLETIYDLEELARCPPIHAGECLYPMACDKCGVLTSSGLSKDFFDNLIHSGIIKSSSLREIDKEVHEILAPLKAYYVKQDKNQREACKKVLSKHYSRYLPDKSKIISDSKEEKQLKEKEEIVPNAYSTAAIGCGRQYQYGQVSTEPLKFLLKLDLVDPAQGKIGQLTFDPEDVSTIFEPLVVVECGKLLSTYGRSPRNLKGTRILRAVKERKGRIELYKSLRLVYREDKNKFEEDLTGTTRIDLIDNDRSGRSFIMHRHGKAAGFFWLRKDLDEALSKLKQINNFLQEGTKQKDTFSQTAASKAESKSSFNFTFPPAQKAVSKPVKKSPFNFHFPLPQRQRRTERKSQVAQAEKESTVKEVIDEVAKIEIAQKEDEVPKDEKKSFAPEKMEEVPKERESTIAKQSFEADFIIPSDSEDEEDEEIIQNHDKDPNVAVNTSNIGLFFK